MIEWDLMQYSFNLGYILEVDGLVVSVSTSHEVGCGFAAQPGYTKDHYRNGTNCLSALHTEIVFDIGTVYEDKHY